MATCDATADGSEMAHIEFVIPRAGRLHMCCHHAEQHVDNMPEGTLWLALDMTGQHAIDRIAQVCNFTPRR